MFALTTLFSIVLEALAIAIRQEKELKDKGRNTLFLFADDITVYIEYPPKKLQKIPSIGQFSARSQDIRSIHKNKLLFLHIINEPMGTEIKNTITQCYYIIFTQETDEIFRYKPKKMCTGLTCLNCKTLMKEIKEDLNQWGNISCSRTRRLNILKMSL